MLDDDFFPKTITTESIKIPSVQLEMSREIIAGIRIRPDEKTLNLKKIPMHINPINYSDPHCQDNFLTYISEFLSGHLYPH